MVTLTQSKDGHVLKEQRNGIIGECRGTFLWLVQKHFKEQIQLST